MGPLKILALSLAMFLAGLGTFASGLTHAAQTRLSASENAAVVEIDRSVANVESHVENTIHASNLVQELGSRIGSAAAAAKNTARPTRSATPLQKLAIVCDDGEQKETNVANPSGEERNEAPTGNCQGVVLDRTIANFFGVPITELDQLRDEGLNWGQIVGVLELAKVTGKPVNQIVQMFDETHNLLAVERELGLTPSRIMSLGQVMFGDLRGMIVGARRNGR